MDVKLEKLDGTSAKIVVNIEENDYKSEVDKKLRELGRSHNIPGFRKGHVPMGQLVRIFGRQAKSDVINHKVYDAVVDYIKDNKLNVLGEPLPVELKEVSWEQKDYTFEYEIGYAPEISVKIDKNVTLPFYSIQVDDKMREEQDKMLRQRFGSQEPGEEFEERALVKGVLMQLGEDGNVSEAEDAIQVTSAIVAPFLFKGKEEAKKFEGKKLGDKVVFNPANAAGGEVAEIASMLNIDKERAADVKADFELAISEIIVNREAQLGQEYYDEVFGKDKVHNEEEYNKGIVAMVASQLGPNCEQLFVNMTEKTLVERFGNFELPATFLKKWFIARNEGLTEENIEEEYKKAEPSLRWQLIKEQIVRDNNIKIEDADVMGAAKGYAARQLAQYGMYNLSDEMLGDYAKRILADRESRSRIIEGVGDHKLFNTIKELATIDVKEVSLEQFNEEAKKVFGA